MDTKMQVFQYVLRAMYFLVTQIIAVPVYISIHVFFFPLKKLIPKVFWNIDAHLFRGLLGIVASWLHTAGFEVVESGDCLDSILEDEALLMVNHQSTGDVAVVMESIHSKSMVSGHIMWIMDHVFKFTDFGWVSYWHGDFFVKQPCKTEDEKKKQLEKLKKHIKNVYSSTLKKWIILFPEGGFLSTRKPCSQSFARKKSLPVLENVALPRVGVAQAIVDELAPRKNEGFTDSSGNRKLKWIIDMTIGYPKGEACNALMMILGKSKARRVHVHYRVYDINHVPTDSDSFTKWMYDRYIEKESILGDFYENEKDLGHKDVQQRCLPKIDPRPIQFDYKGAFLQHAFYLISLCWLCNNVYPYIYMCLGARVLAGIVLSYVVFFTYSMVDYFRNCWPSQPDDKKCDNKVPNGHT